MTVFSLLFSFKIFNILNYLELPTYFPFSHNNWMWNIFKIFICETKKIMDSVNMCVANLKVWFLRTICLYKCTVTTVWYLSRLLFASYKKSINCQNNCKYHLIEQKKEENICILVHFCLTKKKTKQKTLLLDVLDNSV